MLSGVTLKLITIYKIVSAFHQYTKPLTSLQRVTNDVKIVSLGLNYFSIRYVKRIANEVAHIIAWQILNIEGFRV